VSRPRAAEDFATIRARIDDLRRDRGSPSEQAARAGKSPLPSERSHRDAELRRRERCEGLPPSWVPTIFVKD